VFFWNRFEHSLDDTRAELLLAQLTHVLNDIIVKAKDLTIMRVVAFEAVNACARRSLLDSEIKDDLNDEIAKLIVDELLYAYLSSCNYFHPLVWICEQYALLHDLTSVLIARYLLEVLQHWCKDHLVASLCPDEF